MAQSDIMILNIPFQTTESELNQFISQFAQIVKLTMIKDKDNRFVGKAYATLQDDESLKEALFNSGKELNERNIIIYKAQTLEQKKLSRDQNLQKKNQNFKQYPKKQINNRKVEQKERPQKTLPTEIKKRTEQYFKINDDNSIFIQNIQWNTSELALGKHFEKYGDIKTVRIQEDNTGKSKGFGYIEFQKQESVQKALVENGSELNSRPIKVMKVMRNLVQYSPTSIYVKELNPITTEMELGKFFEQYGDVKTVKILEDKDGQCLCSGYVNFNDRESVETALKANGCKLKGKEISVLRARMQRKKIR